MLSSAVVSRAVVTAYLQVSTDVFWRTRPGPPVQRARSVARSLVGDLQVVRAAGVGLVPDWEQPDQVWSVANHALRTAGLNHRACEQDLRALRLAHSSGRRWLAHSLGGRLSFPLHGVAGAVGVAAMALDGRKPLWRCHTAVEGVPVPSELLFSAGLDDQPAGRDVAVCADPASALKFRSLGAGWSSGWQASQPVVAPPTRRLTAEQAALIGDRAVSGAVVVVCDEPARAAQFVKVLQDTGLEVGDLAANAAGLRASSRRDRNPKTETPDQSADGSYPRDMTAEGGDRG